MSYNNRAIKTDVNDQPIPQHFNPLLDDYAPTEGINGGPYATQLDGFGNLFYAPQDVVPFAILTNQSSGVMFAEFTAPFSGEAQVQFGLATDSEVSLYGMPSGAVSSGLFGLINDGAAIPAGTVQALSFVVSAGASYGFMLASTQSGSLLVSVRVRG